MVSTDSSRVGKKRKHVSKKNKVSWRKNVDIQDVEDFLEDQRLEERLGTAFASKPDSELFIIDTAPSKSSQRPAQECRLTARQRKLQRQPEHPNCLQSLVNTSQVPLPSGPRNNVKPTTLSKKTEQKKVAKGVYRRKLEVATKNRDIARRRRQDLKDSRCNFKDLWGVEPITPEVKYPKSEWLTLDTVNSNRLVSKPKRPTRRTARVAAIPAPHPGASYNPTFKDHQDLLQSVVNEETKIIKEEKHLQRVTAGMFRKVTLAQKNKEAMAEMQQGLAELEVPEEQSDGEEYRAVNPPVQNRKKDLRTKRHIKEHNLVRATARHDAVEKKKHSDIYKLRFLQKEVSLREETLGLERAARITRRAECPPLPRLNSRPFREPAPVYSDISQLSGNLRSLAPQGGGLMEQLTSLQRRGIAPISVPKVLKKAKKKRYTLASHRLPWENTETPIKPSHRRTARS